MPSLCISTVACFVFGVDIVVGASLGHLRASRACAQNQPNFDGFLRDHGKKYEPEQYGARLSLYEKNARFVSEHNCQTGRRWTATINKFSDWSPHELAMTFGELKVARDFPHRHEGTLVQEEVTPAKPMPDTMDWTHLNATKDIMDQGACGSCWAVGSAALLRAHAEIAQGTDPGRFSVQQLVSCVPNEHQCGGEGGCKGGTTELALKYVLSRGLMKEAEFPYTASNKACPTGNKLSQVDLDNVGSSLIEGNGNQGGLTIGLKGFRIMEENKMSSLMEALQTGPAKVSIAVPDGFHYYSSGVMDGCPKDSVLTHASLVIGYGEEHGEDYWLMQNSWGKDWGDNGYFKFLRRSASFEESDDGCGVDDEPLFGNGCKTGPNKSPSTIRVCGMCGILNNIVIPIFQQ